MVLRLLCKGSGSDHGQCKINTLSCHWDKLYHDTWPDALVTHMYLPEWI